MTPKEPTKEEILSLFRYNLMNFFVYDRKDDEQLTREQLEAEIFQQFLKKEDFISEFNDLWRELYE